MKWFFALLSGLCIAAAAPLAAAEPAAGVGPDQLVKTVTEEVLTIVRNDKDIQNGNAKKAISLVEVKVLPHFNFTRMTRLAVGREWRNASPEQQKSLSEEFKTLLVRTYSKALTEYRNQTIEYRPFELKAGETDAKVKTLIKQPGSAKPIELDYSLEQQNSAWKVYDIEVAGVSLVTNYRDTFATEIRNNGIDGLIKALQTKNASADKK
ncbi:MAG TPA: ABC transporter substrate-binding protein [Rhodocyclaceae bacterium]|nr:ABC transporter substrate-binding protein [Rhodocyclaceae bacterium]